MIRAIHGWFDLLLQMVEVTEVKLKVNWLKDAILKKIIVFGFLQKLCVCMNDHSDERKLNPICTEC